MKTLLKDKTKILMALIAATVMCLGLIWLTAYSTSLQYQINTLNSKIQDSEWTKRNIEVSIKSANTLSSLEARAKDMGLVVPTFDEIVYLNSEENTVHDFALALQEIAYNK